MDHNEAVKIQGQLSISSSSELYTSSNEDLQNMPLAPPKLRNNKRRLSRQLSLASTCETPRDAAWEKRRRQILTQRKSFSASDLTDEDLYELKGSIELGFGFNEEEGQMLCNTLPALDLYFAVNRQVSPSPVSTPGRKESAAELEGRSSSFGSESDWKICSPGENPEQVKTRLRHWAQAVACAVIQSS